MIVFSIISVITTQFSGLNIGEYAKMEKNRSGVLSSYPLGSNSLRPNQYNVCQKKILILLKM